MRIAVIIPLLLASACGANTRASDPNACMAPGELGAIVTRSDVLTDHGRYGGRRQVVLVRFRMQRYLPARGRIRVCETQNIRETSMLRLGDVMNPRDMRDVTP